MISIDGSHLEGGGQIIRTAIALSVITRKPVHILNIRKGRDNPGLRPQHLNGISAAASICDAQISGLRMKSADVTFIPGRIKAGKYSVDTKTAGSVTLILQTLAPIGLVTDTPLELRLRGGTAVPFSPTIGYFAHVLSPLLHNFGIDLTLDIQRHGFYPKGGGDVLVGINSSGLRSVSMLDRGQLESVKVWVIASHHLKSARVAERILHGFNGVVSDAETQCSYVDAMSPGCFIAACASYQNGMIGSDALGKRGKPAERVGMEAAIDLKEAMESGASVDKWMVDQLIPFMALAAQASGEPSEVSIPGLTKHAQTNIWVVQKFLQVDFNVGNNVLRCTRSA